MCKIICMKTLSTSIQTRLPDCLRQAKSGAVKNFPIPSTRHQHRYYHPPQVKRKVSRFKRFSIILVITRGVLLSWTFSVSFVFGDPDLPVRKTSQPVSGYISLHMLLELQLCALLILKSRFLDSYFTPLPLELHREIIFVVESTHCT